MFSCWSVLVLTPGCHIPTSIEAEDHQGARHLGATLVSARAERTGVSCRAHFSDFVDGAVHGTKLPQNGRVSLREQIERELDERAIFMKRSGSIFSARTRRIRTCCSTRSHSQVRILVSTA